MVKTSFYSKLFITSIFSYIGTKGNASGKNCQSLQKKKYRSGIGRLHRLPVTSFILLMLLGPFY